jgi:5-methylcytosine-specific restriction protein B
MKDGNCIAIGWPALGDLSGYEHNQEGRDAIRALMTQKYYPDSPSTAGRKAMEVFRFAVVIPDGSLVLTSDGAKVLGIGKVSGPYRYEPKMDFPHRRLVEWLSLEEWSQPKPEGLQTTVFEIRDALNIVEAEKKLLYRETVDVVIKPDVSKLGGLPARIHSVLVRKGQVIVYGPPGTGKTYWAEISACELAARSHFGLPYAQLNDEQKEALLGGAVRMCTFHPAYGYEDFLEGYRAETSGEQMVFVLRDGIFKKLCQDAWNEPGKKFYLIIDEINRGDIPRIFGELLTILEKNKRGKKVLLPLSGRFFQVPDNVYIIGTMNTADRSIALLDTALRRRFGFIELMPDSSVLDNRVIEGIPLGPWLDALNQRICEHVGRDARNLQVGHSFFLEGGRVISDFAKLARVIQEDIVPLLEEYCYEDYDSLEKILGRKLIDMQNQKVRHELFDPSRQDELIVALVAPSHEISTSSQAVTSEEQISDDGEEENGGKNATDQE